METKKQFLARMERRRLLLSTKVESKIKAQVVAIAKREQRTVSQVISILVTEALEARQSKEKVA